MNKTNRHPAPSAAASSAAASFAAASFAAAALAALCCLSPLAPAAPATTARGAPKGDEIIKLDAINVTAMREAKRFYETPASVVTLDPGAIKATGGESAYEIVRFADGIVIDSMGPAGQSYGAMFSKTILRGSARGTLVLIDGMPANINGYYNMEDIPVQSIKRVEILKGASSTLYGSEAIGGVINITTRNNPGNTATLSLGANDYQNYSFSLGSDWTIKGAEGGVSLTGIYQNLGEITRMNSAASNGQALGYGGGIKRLGRVDLRQGRWHLSYQHSENQYDFQQYENAYANDWTRITQISSYDDAKDYARLSGRGANWSANFYYNHQKRDYQTHRNLLATPNKSADIGYNALSFGGDLQYTWKPAWADFLFGLTLYRESYEQWSKLNGAVTADVGRNDYSLFARASKTLLDDWTLSLSLRESYNTGDGSDAFTPQIQLLKKFPRRLSAYANAGRIFNLPTLKQLYDTTTSQVYTNNPDLAPEKGWNYETGVKWEGENTLLGLALFHMDLDHITYKQVGSPSISKPFTVPFKNTGIELTATQRLGQNFKIEAGASYSTPKDRTLDNSNNLSAWRPLYGKIQANLRVRYETAACFASFNISYLGKRPYYEAVRSARPDLIPTTLKVGANLGKHRNVQAALVLDNVFNRRDITSHGDVTSAPRNDYFCLPRNLKATVSVSF
jgi:iron complex outermembrane receptor protein